MKREEGQNEQPLSLSQSFKKAAKISALIVTTSYLSINIALHTLERIESRKGEPLTDDEIELAEKVFGDALNTRIVRKHFDNGRSGFRAYVHMEDDRNIYFLGEDNISANYAEDQRMHAYKTFIHEMTHIWQHQEQSFYRNINNSCRTYDYELTTSSQFDELCNEQQASVIGDYAIIFLSPWREMSDLEYDGNEEQLRRVVEEKFPAAKLAREKLEQEETPAQKPLSYVRQQSTIHLTLNSLL